jgi:NADPH:quinone reductase-like Zn-dependent oxidoreductase
MVTRMLTGIRHPRHGRLGLDAAGEVAAVGPGVTRLAPGDRVVADLTEHGFGAFAELALAPEAAWHPVPAAIDLVSAATLPQSGILAVQGLRHHRPVRRGDRVLINGASGNIGPFAVQLAKAAGAEVTGVASTAKLDLVRSLGADHVIDHTRQDPLRGDIRYDRILDPAGVRSVLSVRHALAPGGIHSSYGGPTTYRVFHTMVVGPLLSVGRDRSMGIMLPWKPNDATDLATLFGHVEAGSLVPAIDRTYRLEQVPAALERLAAGEARGKLVIEV